MKKICNYFLFFVFIIVASLNAAELSEEEWSEESNLLLNEIPVVIKHPISQMKEILPFLKEKGISLEKTVVFFDFDETLGMTVGEYKDHQFSLLPSPDQKRTYKEVFMSAFKNQEENFDSFNFTSLKHASRRYKVLDPDAVDLIQKLKEEALFTGVCSGLSADFEREMFLLKNLSVGKNQYIHASNKAQAICSKLATIVDLNPTAEISAVILIDNSKVYGIDPFIKDLPGLVAKLYLQPLTIIGIEFTKFSEMATQEAIEKELSQMKNLINVPTPEEEQLYWLRKLSQITPKEKCNMLEKIKKMPSYAIGRWKEENKRMTS